MRERLAMITTSLCGGLVQEKIDRALRAVTNNILDPNTSPTKKRSIALKITFTPREDDREDVTVTAEVTTTLAQETAVKTKLFVAKDMASGRSTIQEFQRGEIKGQMSLGDIREDEETEERQEGT